MRELYELSSEFEDMARGFKELRGCL